LRINKPRRQNEHHAEHINQNSARRPIVFLIKPSGRAQVYTHIQRDRGVNSCRHQAQGWSHFTLDIRERGRVFKIKLDRPCPSLFLSPSPIYINATTSSHWSIQNANKLLAHTHSYPTNLEGLFWRSTLCWRRRGMQTVRPFLCLPNTNWTCFLLLLLLFLLLAA